MGKNLLNRLFDWLGDVNNNSIVKPGNQPIDLSNRSLSVMFWPTSISFDADLERRLESEYKTLVRKAADQVVYRFPVIEASVENHGPAIVQVFSCPWNHYLIGFNEISSWDAPNLWVDIIQPFLIKNSIYWDINGSKNFGYFLGYR